EANVDEWTDNPSVRRRPLHVVQAERDLIATQQRIHAIVVPGGLPEFHRVPITGRKHRQEVLEALEVDGPARRKLIQHRAQLGTELPDVFEEAAQRILGILELLHVCQEATGFDGVDKASRRLLSPFRKCARLRQSVEAVVDLDRIEAEGVMAEPARLRQVGRIEVAAPMFVLPSGTADPKLLFTAEHHKSCYDIYLQASAGPIES